MMLICIYQIIVLLILYVKLTIISHLEKKVSILLLKNKTLSKIFASDKLDFDEEFKINRVYSDLYTTEIFAPQQRSDF